MTSKALEELGARLAASERAGRLSRSASMARYTSMRVGGPADMLLEAADPAEVLTALRAAAELNVPYLVIGLGTNLLVLDGGIRGLVVRIGPQMGYLEWDDPAPAVKAGAGVALASLAAAAAARGYSGLEWAEGIPGTLGGAVVMNAGAYGGEMSDQVTAVEALNLAKLRARFGAARRHMPAPKLGFSYRYSILQRGGHVVLEVHLGLERDDPEQIRARMAEFAARRRERQPLELASAGSFFMRPAGHFVGPMIEECGLKGLRVGGAEVSRKHANFIVNVGQASAADILALAGEVRQAVKERFGVDLEPEVRIIGEHPAAG